MFKLIYIVLLTVLISSLDARRDGIDDLESLLKTVDEYERSETTERARSFSIKPDDNVLINLNYKPAKLRPNSYHGKAEHKKSKRKGPEYYLNFTFQNYRNPKEGTKNKLKKNKNRSAKMLDTDFPLKGEDP